MKNPRLLWTIASIASFIAAAASFLAGNSVVGGLLAANGALFIALSLRYGKPPASEKKP